MAILSKVSSKKEVTLVFSIFSGKGLKIMNFGDMQTANGVTAVLQNDDDDAVDPHLERIKNQAGGDESDEEVLFLRIHVSIMLCSSYMSFHLDSHLFMHFYCL